MAASAYYVERNGKRFGPYSSAKLKELAARGKIRHDDMISLEGTNKTIIADDVKGLFQTATTRETPPQPGISPVASIPPTPPPAVNVQSQLNADAKRPWHKHSTVRVLAVFGLVSLLFVVVVFGIWWYSNQKAISWYVAESLTSGFLGGSIELTDESKDKGLVFLVIELEITRRIVEGRPPTDEEKKESPNAQKVYEMRGNLFSLSLPDGSKVHPVGTKNPISGFISQTDFNVIPGGDGPGVICNGVFFLVSREIAENGGLKFHAKNMPTVGLKTWNHKETSSQ